MAWDDTLGSWGRPGHADRGHEKEAVRHQITSLTDPGWTTDSAFTLNALSVNPTQGNSTYLGRYRRPSEGDDIQYEFYILIGSTFSAGSGVYRFPVPFAASASAILCATGSGYIFDNGTANRTGILRFEASTYFNFFINAAASAITHTGSGTAWATGDIISGSIRYEPA